MAGYQNWKRRNWKCNINGGISKLEAGFMIFFASRSLILITEIYQVPSIYPGSFNGSGSYIKDAVN